MTLPDTPPFGQPPAPTMLDALLVDLNSDPALNDTVFMPIVKRPGWEVECNTDIDGPSLSAWRKNAQDPSMAQGVNEVKLACTILSNTTVKILINGEPIVDRDGNPCTFTSTALMAKFGAENPGELIRKVFHRDGFVTATSTALLKEAGYGAEVSPTRR